MQDEIFSACGRSVLSKPGRETGVATLQTSYKAPWVELVVGIKGRFQRTHQGKIIARRPPHVTLAFDLYWRLFDDPTSMPTRDAGIEGP